MGCSVALRSREEQKSLQNLLAISQSEEKLGKARITDSRTLPPRAPGPP